MEKPFSLRLFYALWPDEAARTALQLLQQQLPLTGRKVAAENLHITLAFLGEQAEDRVPLLKQILMQQPGPALSLKLDRLGYFNRSRIAWVGMQAPPEALMNLQADLRQSLAREGIGFEAGAKFVPHVSLARSAAPLPECSFAPIVWDSMQLVLVRSVLLPAGSRYDVIAAR